MINNRIGQLFPPAVVATGYIFLLLGLFLMVFSPFVGIFLGVLGAVAAFAQTKVQIDSGKRLFRTCTTFLGFSFGKWHSFEGYSDIAVLRRQMSTTAFSRSNRSAKTGSDVHFDIFLLDGTHRVKQLIARSGKMEDAISAARSLANELGLKYEQYNPATSANTRVRR